ncbi:hypothetical protein [Helicobacter mehlei]|uniref:Uncharacterized protein n=1 Tax=Helicobacter mehlei TaxID=2316080 RepID=A0A553V2C5_9HELI|nr:hypothetical protein [Helicobacter mehlei]TSA86582.1 hypothetical protein FNE76_01215 [Helicobacter mehlei]
MAKRLVALLCLILLNACQQPPSPKKPAQFEFNNTEIFKRQELQQRQSNQPSDLFKTDASINVSTNQAHIRTLSSDLARISIDGAYQ